jgi:23S rRNA (pseudouridine1915-N3)-methyltransferase
MIDGMHKIVIKAVGKAQESWQKEAIQTYVDRLAPFAKLEIVEVTEGHKGSAKPDEVKTKNEEAISLLKNLPKDATVICLDETGRNHDSQSFSKKLEGWTEGGRPVVFLIGGSWGLDASVKQAANETISFGKQTLPHLLARVLLLEQLYRAETILAGKTYHK